MSIANWMSMVDKGIAGEDTVTCFVAALDCLLNEKDIPYKIYAQYTQAYFYQYYHGIDRRKSRHIYQEVLKHSIGSSCLKNFITKRISTLEDTILTVNKAQQGRKNIIINVSQGHVVGLKPVRQNIWIMVGNSLPCDDEITTTEIFDYLYIPPRIDNQANIFLIN